MITIKKISKYLQIGLLLTFFLPFFPNGCKESSVPQNDSTKVEVAVPANIDTSLIDAINIDTKKVDISLNLRPEADSSRNKSIDSTNRTKSSKDETISDRLIKRFSFLKYLLKPNNKCSGIGYIIDMTYLTVVFSGVVIAFFLWIIGMILKFRRNKWFQTINIAGLILFYFTDPNPIMFGFGNLKLWGYWICFWWAFVMIILDLYILVKIRKTGA